MFLHLNIIHPVKPAGTTAKLLILWYLSQLTVISANVPSLYKSRSLRHLQCRTGAPRHPRNCRGTCHAILYYSPQRWMKITLVTGLLMVESLFFFLCKTTLLRYTDVQKPTQLNVYNLISLKISIHPRNYHPNLCHKPIPHHQLFLNNINIYRTPFSFVIQIMMSQRQYVFPKFKL